MNLSDIIQVPENRVEVIEKRTSSSKIFDLGNNKYKMVKIVSPIHYKNNLNDNNEQWKDIDLTPEDKGDKFIVNKAPYNLEIPKDKIGLSYASKEGGNIVIKLKSIGGVNVEQLDLGISPRIEGNQIWWDNIANDLDIYLNLRPAGIEFFKIIKTVNGPKELEWEIEEDEQHKLRVNGRHIGFDVNRDEVRLEKEILNERIEDGKKKYILKEKFFEQTVKIEDKKTRIKEWADNINYPLLIDVPDITENITNDADDGYEYNSAFWLNGSYIKVGKGSYEYHAGLRFQTIGVPQGATIDLANLKFYVQYKSGTPLSKIYGDDVDDAVAWSASNRPTQITKTTANTNANPTTTGLKTYDVTDIVQEIVDRDSWVSDNDMRFGVINQAVGSTYFRFYDYLHSSGDPSVLEIDYTEGGGSSIKSWNGLAKASIKSINGLAIASVKSINGLE